MTHRKGSAGTTAAIVLALIALSVAVGGVMYRQQVTPQREAAAAQDALIARMTGVDNAAVTNALDPRYTDADGDLVADVAPAAQQIDPPTLTFSYVVSDEQDEFKTAFAGLMDALSKATGKPVEFVPYVDLQEKLLDLRHGKLTVSGLATGAVPIGVCTAGFVPVCQSADASGETGYKMVIIVPADSPITKLSDLRGRELAFTEPSSNSGYKAPLVALREIGLRPAVDYRIRYSQGHTQSIEGIKSKMFQAAAVAADVLKREEAAGKIGPGDYKIVYTSDQTFPGAAIGYSCLLKPELAAKIRGVLTSYDFKGNGLEKLFAAEGKTKLVPTDYKKEWAFVRRIDESIGFPYALREPATQPTTQTAAVQ